MKKLISICVVIFITGCAFFHIAWPKYEFYHTNHTMFRVNKITGTVEMRENFYQRWTVLR